MSKIIFYHILVTALYFFEYREDQSNQFILEKIDENLDLQGSVGTFYLKRSAANFYLHGSVAGFCLQKLAESETFFLL